MATRFVAEATQQYAPAYAQQISGLESQVPAIQQLYSILNQSLLGQQQVGNQNILEDASSKGVLRSTIPVDRQAGLGQQIIQQQGLNAAQQAKEIGGIRSQVGGLQIEKVNAIAQLANALQQAFSMEEQTNLSRYNSDREYQLAREVADRQWVLGLQAAKRGYR